MNWKEKLLHMNWKETLKELFAHTSWIKVLFFGFSFTTFLTHGITNNIFMSRIRNSDTILVLLLINIIFFIFGKIYGNLLDSVPLRLVAYLCLAQAALSIFLIPSQIVINSIATYIKSFIVGIEYAIIFSIMSRKTEGWKLKKYQIPILIFIAVTISTNLLVYFFNKLNAYFTILIDSTIGFTLYRISSDNLNMDEIIEDTDKLTDVKVIFNAFLNSTNSIVIFILQKERSIIIAQFVSLVILLTHLIFIIYLGAHIFLENQSTHYYLCIKALQYVDSYIENETAKRHIQRLCKRLEARMIGPLPQTSEIVVGKNPLQFIKKFLSKLLKK